MGPHVSLMLQTSRPEIDEETSFASARSRKDPGPVPFSIKNLRNLRNLRIFNLRDLGFVAARSTPAHADGPAPTC